VRGIVKHWDLIKQINFDNYDILLFCEIWQIRSFENLHIENFKIANVFQRENQRGGGVIVYIRSNIKYEAIEAILTDGVIESVAIKVKNTVFMILYRPPAGNKNQFVEKLIEWIETKRGYNLYIAGDFNINYLNNEKTFYDKIKDETGLEPRIKKPTRIASGTCIDNILTNIDKQHKISNICIADHQGLISNIQLSFVRTKQKEYKYREMSERNWSNFSTQVTGLSIRGNNINEKWSTLCHDIKSIVDTSFPEKMSKNNYKFNMSQGLLKSRNRKNKLLKKYRRGEIPKEEYIRYNKIYRNLITKEKEKSFHDKIVACNGNSKKKWRELKAELKLSQADNNITSLSINNESITDNQKMAEAMKNHFETCATNLANDVPNSGPCEILTEQQPEWGFNPITQTELLKIIDSLLPKNSSGFDGLTNRMIKKEKVKFSRLIINLINETITSGIFPEVLKIAKVIPIYKKGDKMNPNNYRPIALLPVLSKVLEKVINTQLNRKLDEYHVIDDDQYGFRPNHSTEDAVIKFTDYIEKAKTKYKYVISIHIDVSKAFDSCNHEIMRDKLKRIGLNSNSLNLMTSYLHNRVQEVWLNDKHGGRFIINIGVGQGTVLGPTLFKIYIMDMYLSTGLFSLRFADDSNLVGVGNNKEITERNINRELEKLHNWFCQNKLTLHPDKSRYMLRTPQYLRANKI